MKKQIFLLMILLAFTVLIATPMDTASAKGAKLVHFTATSTSLCPGDPRCYPGDFELQQSGKVLITGYAEAMLFTASDPRWNAVCVFTADPMLYNDSHAFPIMGSFTCTATDPAFQGGRWEGTLNQVAQPDKWIAVWDAKGYGVFEGLQTTVRNTTSSAYDVVPPEANNVGVITELPWYQP